MDNLNILRSNRKTVSISVYSGCVTVKCPNNFTRKQIDEVIDKKRGWINKMLYKDQTRYKKFAKVFNYETVLIAGREYQLAFADRSFFNGSTVYVKNLADLNGIIEKYFFDSFINLCNRISARTGLYPNSITLAKFKSYWGTCDNYGAVRFNYKLLMVPEELQVPVIIHEFCHLVHLNHSQKFKKLLKSYCPEVNELDKELEEYSFLRNIY